MKGTVIPYIIFIQQGLSSHCSCDVWNPGPFSTSITHTCSECEVSGSLEVASSSCSFGITSTMGALRTEGSNRSKIMVVVCFSWVNSCYHEFSSPKKFSEHGGTGVAVEQIQLIRSGMVYQNATRQPANTLRSRFPTKKRS